MKFAIITNKTKKKLNTKNFNSEEDAKSCIKNTIKYWKSIFKSNKCKTSQLNIELWKKSTIIPINFEDNFVDFDIVFINQTKFNSSPQSKIINFAVDSRIQKGVELTLSKRNGR